MDDVDYFNAVGEHPVDHQVVRMGDELARTHGATNPSEARVLAQGFDGLQNP